MFWDIPKQKYNTERIIEKYFTVDIDYIKLAPPIGGSTLSARPIEKARLNNVLSDEKVNVDKSLHGGHNIKKIMMTIKYFKSLCLKAQTKKGLYYIS